MLTYYIHIQLARQIALQFPKHLLRLFLASKVILFSKVIFKSARKIPIKTRVK